MQHSWLRPDRVAAGQRALDVPLKRLEGGTAALREHLGEPLVVLIWATWSISRGQLPVWQLEWPGLRPRGARLVTVAADADFAATKAFAGKFDFTTLVDTDSRLAAILGYRVVANGYLFGRDGTLLDEQVSDFDLKREPTTRAIVKGWFGFGDSPTRRAPRPGSNTAIPAALALFAEGEALLEKGERERGLARWHAAFKADPESYVVRKQIWRALYPARFGEPIDGKWQDRQLAREQRIGFAQANPGLPPPATI